MEVAIVHRPHHAVGIYADAELLQHLVQVSPHALLAPLPPQNQQRPPPPQETSDSLQLGPCEKLPRSPEHQNLRARERLRGHTIPSTPPAELFRAPAPSQPTEEGLETLGGGVALPLAR